MYTYTGSSTQAPEGCAMFAVNFYGGNDKVLSIYEYQPKGGKMAFTNSLYNEEAMARISSLPPTRLTQV
jgi:hypothetical protein